jgi:hypothetical protein
LKVNAAIVVRLNLYLRVVLLPVVLLAVVLVQLVLVAVVSPDLTCCRWFNNTFTLIYISSAHEWQWGNGSSQIIATYDGSKWTVSIASALDGGCSGVYEHTTASPCGSFTLTAVSPLWL